MIEFMILWCITCALWGVCIYLYLENKDWIERWKGVMYEWMCAEDRAWDWEKAFYDKPDQYRDEDGRFITEEEWLKKQGL